MPNLNNMRDGFPQITEHNGVPIPFTLWRKNGKSNITAVVDLSDPRNPKWMTLPAKADKPPAEVPVNEVLCWSLPHWL